MTRSRTIARNSAYMYLRMLVVLGASLYSVRVLLAALGIEDFGIYALAAGMVTLFAFLNATMTRAAQRFLGIELGKEDGERLGPTFNAILVANGAVAVLVVLVSLTLGWWLLNQRFNIPGDRVGAANVVLYLSVLTTVALVMRTPFSALIISHQKLWFFSMTSVVEALLKLAIAFLISRAPQDRLISYAALMCASSWLLLAWYAVFCWKRFPESGVRLHRQWALYRALLGFTGWSFIGNFAHVVRTQGVNMLLNVFFGTSLNAAHGVMMQAQGAATQFTSSFELALSPQIYKSYGQGNRREVQDLVFLGSKLNFMLLAVLVGPAIFAMDFLLQLWLGRTVEYLSLFVSWMLLLQLVETVSQPLMVAALATGNIKRYQLAVGGTILLNLPLSWLAFELGFGPTAFLYVAFAIQVATFALRVAFMRRMIDMDVASFFRRVVLPLLLISLLAGAMLRAAYLLGDPDTWPGVIVGGGGIALGTAVACFLLGLDGGERRRVVGMLLKSRKRKSGSSSHD